MQVNNNEILLADLNEQQKKAVKHMKSHLLIVAGAGSGKTTVLVRKIAYIINSKFAYSYQILAITFTNKAANQLRERVADLLGDNAVNMWTMTFHSMCSRILRYHINELSKVENYSLNNTFTIYDSADILRLVTIICNDLKINTDKFPPRSLVAKISNWKNSLLMPLDVEKNFQEQSGEFLATATKVYKEYQKRMMENNACDFDDLILYTVQLFEKVPAILKIYQERFKYIFVDEYQDTNHAQYLLIKYLTGTNQSYLTVVGDADQSIYAFRGATIRNIEEFSKDFSDAETIVLEQNYRSKQTILSAANSLISKNGKRVEKKLWSALGEGEKIIVSPKDNEYLEAENVVSQINEYLDNTPESSLDDIAIIYRTNNVARVFEDAFVRNGITYKVVGGLRFYERKEIKDILSYLKLISNTSDNIAFLRIVNTPKRGIGEKAIDNLRAIAAAEQTNLFNAISFIIKGSVKVSARVKNIFTDFYNLIIELKAKSLDIKDAQTLSNFISLVIEATGYKESLSDSLDFTDNSRLENIYELVALAANFDFNDYDNSDPFEIYKPLDDTFLNKFLEQVSLSSEADNIDSQGTGSVTLMTLHTAKGLEYPVVFLVGMSEGLFPHFRAFNDEAELEEERRLAYVGITRAKNKLYLSFSMVRNNFGRQTPVLASRFLQEISPEVLEWGNYSNQNSFLPKDNISNWEGIPINNSANDFRIKSQKTFSKNIDWQVGDLVNHDKYGMGKIIDKNGEGITGAITIDFGNDKIIKLMTWGNIPLEKL